MKTIFLFSGCAWLAAPLILAPSLYAQSPAMEERLKNALQKYPQADTNKDGVLSLREAIAFRNQMRRGAQGGNGIRQPKKRKIGSSSEPHTGWQELEFPAYAASKLSPEALKRLYAKQVGEQNAVVSRPKPTDGSLRIIGTGHSFKKPGYAMLEQLSQKMQSQQTLYTHTQGGERGGVRYKWEQENGIFRFDKRPEPKLLCSLANGEWDVMTWGPYHGDRPKHYTCWMDFALKYQPEMKFYLMDAWPQRLNFKPALKSDDDVTHGAIGNASKELNLGFQALLTPLREKYGDRVFVIPTNAALTRLVQHHLQNPIAEVKGIFQPLNGNVNSIWRDQRGHLHPTFHPLIGYVYYATLYQKDPKDLPRLAPTVGAQPSEKLDQLFRKIAWEVVQNHPLSGVNRSSSALKSSQK